MYNDNNETLNNLCYFVLLLYTYLKVPIEVVVKIDI